MDFAFQVATEKVSESVRELSEHLDCKEDHKGQAMLAELVEYVHMTVVILNDRLRQKVNHEHGRRS